MRADESSRLSFPAAGVLHHGRDLYPPAGSTRLAANHADSLFAQLPFQADAARACAASG